MRDVAAESGALQAIVPELSEEQARALVLAADGDINRALNFHFNNVETGRQGAAAREGGGVPAAEGPTGAVVARSGGADPVPSRPPAPPEEQQQRSAQPPSSGKDGQGEGVWRSVEECGLAPSSSSGAAGEDWREIRANCRAAGVKFTDPNFPPTPESIDGRRVSKNFGNSKVQCSCLKDARLRKVHKDGRNQGRLFYSCWERKCNFFAWGNTAVAHTAQASRLEWQRFDREHLPVSPKRGFAPADVLQGAVGDCWFLSGLAVIAERKDLVARVFPRCEKNEEGVYEARFFIDGRWRSYVVDCCLPTAKGGRLAFAKSHQSQLWVPLVEKAYAKAHGR